MRTLILVSLAVAAVLSGSAVAAAPLPQAGQGAAGAGYVPTAKQLRAAQGVYPLADGKSVRLTVSGHRLYAHRGGHGAIELLPVRENEFVSQDGATTMVLYSPQPSGDKILISYQHGAELALPPRLAMNATSELFIDP